MKIDQILKIVGATVLLFIATRAYTQDSRRVLFNDGWRFHKGDTTGPEKITFNDDGWRRIQIPHDWSVEGPFSEEWASGTGYLPGGIGWYRKSFSLDDQYSGKQLYLYFDGIYKNSEVWINGKYLGKRPNGYVSFYYDISPYLKKGGRNILAVKVDHTDFADSRWYTGSGINRNVYIIPTAPIHIDIWGTAFTTPDVSTSSATVNVKVVIKNISGRTEQIQITSEVVSSGGKIVGSSQKKLSIPARGMSAELSFKVNAPMLWSVSTPALYTLRTSLSRNGEVFDTTEDQVGFRTFSFHADKGFFLNGENIKLKGVCFHDDAGALGSAVPRAVWESRLKTLKEMGCNAIRMSHNPHQDYLYDLCDQMGFLVQDEAFDEWEVGKNKWIKGWNVGTPGKAGYSKDFTRWAEADLRDMILRNRNRTSIIMWSIGNEIDYPNDPYTHEILNSGRNPQIYGKGYVAGNPPAKRLGEIAEKLAAVVKKHDGTRPVTAALAGVVMSNTTTYPEALDLAGYNYQEYRYPEDHEKYSTRIIYGSENSKSFEAWKAVAENDFISGQFLWTAFDFLGEARAWPVRSSGAGLIDMAGFPKPEFYHRKSLWSDEPVLFLAGSSMKKDDSKEGTRNRQTQAHWDWNPGDSIAVQCFTNLEEVELFQNGKLIGKHRRKTSDNTLVKWTLKYEPGELVAKGYQAGQFVLDNKLVSTTAPVKLIAKPDKNKIRNHPDDLALIEINILDSYGRLAGNASNTVTVTIEGPAKLIGLESGSLSSYEDYKSNSRRSVAGRLLAYVQADGIGQIKVIISSPNLLSYEVLLESK